MEQPLLQNNFPRAKPAGLPGWVHEKLIPMIVLLHIIFGNDPCNP